MKQEQTKTKESIQSLHQSLQIAIESQSIAKHTETLLECQTEQLQSMDRKLDDTKQSLKRSERIVQRIKSIGITILSKISNVFVQPKNKSEKHLDNKNIVINTSITQSETNYLDKAKNTLHNKENRIEDEQLDQLTSIIKDLKQSANKINKELSLQDKIIDDITIKTDETSETFKKLTKTINNIK
jgi:hypothetical protein